MPALWTLPPDISIIDDGTVKLSDGRVFSLSDVPGNGFNANRLARINAAIQARIDLRILRTDLPVDDPDRTINPNNPRMFWSDADGTPNASGLYLCSRSVLVWLTYENGVLVPYCRDVR